MSDAHHLSDLPADEDPANDGPALEQASASTADAAQPDVDSSAPFVSLFSPNIPSIVPPPPSDSIAASSSNSSRGHAGGSPSNSLRPLASLASIPAMTKRAARKKGSVKQAPIAQFNTQIPQALKDTDDPTTPVDSNHGGDPRANSYQTLRALFSTDVPNSWTPSYQQASGPLYLRASNDSMSLPDHLYTRGLLEGRHSDITIIAFGQRYNLHRLMLDRAPFFTTALSEPWIESQSREVSLYPEQIDNNITQAAFELAIKKLYGVDISKECDVEAAGLFATGCWLEMQDLIDSSIESILRQMCPELLSPLIRLVTANYYGRSGDRILESAKAMLSRNGWEMSLKYWDGMPGDIIRELVASDGFFVDSEWDRWVLTKRLLDRRLRQAAVDAGLMQRGQRPIPKAPNSLSLMAVRFDAIYRQNSLPAQAMPDGHHLWVTLYTNPDIERILVLLDEGIHYIHMDFEQLEFIRNARDIFGLPVMPEKVISNALWQQLALRQKVLNADETSQELGLCKSPPEPSVTNEGTKSAGMPSSSGIKRVVLYSPEEDAVESGSWDGNAKPRKFWIPSSDCNIVLGNGADPVVTTSSSFQRHATRLSATIQPEDAQWATDFASSPSTMANPNARTDHPVRPISAGGGNAGQPKPISYTEFPPFRFSAEFPNPRFLKEKKRVYSRTVSYAGSLWNIYIQKVRSAKNVQLGVYLHRAKEREPDEVQGNGLSQQNVGTVDERIGQLEREMILRSERRERRRSNRTPMNDQAGEEETSGSGGDPDATLLLTNSRNRLSGSTLGSRRSDVFSNRLSNASIMRASGQFQFPIPASPPTDCEPIESPFFPLGMYSTSDPGSDASDDDSADDEPETAYPNPSLTSLLPTTRKSRQIASTLPTYVDGRPTIRTYFKIYSPSKGGRMLSIYESAPDRFNFSQSWGWKSSTLMLDESIVSADGESMETGGGTGKKGDGKLRFMVVIGNL